jgi:hypothetical protein
VKVSSEQLSVNRKEDSISRRCWHAVRSLVMASHFEELDDPRIERTRKHSTPDTDWLQDEGTKTMLLRRADGTSLDLRTRSVGPCTPIVSRDHTSTCASR